MRSCLLFSVTTVVDKTLNTSEFKNTYKADLVVANKPESFYMASTTVTLTDIDNIDEI